MMSTKYVFIIVCLYDAEYINLHKKKSYFLEARRWVWKEKESRQSQFLSVVNNTNTNPAWKQDLSVEWAFTLWYKSTVRVLEEWFVQCLHVLSKPNFYPVPEH